MKVVAVPATLVGLGLTMVAGYRILSGPFGSGGPAEPASLMLSLAGFVVGLIVLAWGSARIAGVGARL